MKWVFEGLPEPRDCWARRLFLGETDGGWKHLPLPHQFLTARDEVDENGKVVHHEMP